MTEHTPTMDADRLPRLQAQVERQQRELAELRARLDALLPAPTDGPRLDRFDRLDGRADAAGEPAERGDGPDAAGEPAIARRHLLRGAALAAGATGAGVMALGATATPAAAASGTFDGAPAVTATGLGGEGVVATTDNDGGVAVNASTSADNARGVYGYSKSGVGVVGETDGPIAAVQALNNDVGFALDATSAFGDALYAYSQKADGTAVIAVGPTGVRTVSFFRQLSLGTGPNNPTQSVIGYEAGDIVCDTAGDLWHCVATGDGGQPGTWRRLSGPSTAGVLALLPAPVRVYDSRPGQAPLAVGPKTPMTDGTDRTVDANFAGAGIPLGATGVLMNLAVTGTNSGGFLGAYRNGISWPGNASVNWGLPASTINALCVSAVDAQGRFALHCGGSTDVIVDVVGYYR